MQIWRIRLFGALEIESPSGAVTAFAGTKAGGILAYLALNTGKTVTREELADAFWADSDPNRQRTRVRQEIMALRTLFGADETSPLQISPQSARLSADFVTTDVAQFLGLLDEAKNADDNADKERALSRAVTLYRGDLLTGYLDIGVAERSTYSQRFETALRDLARLHQARGDFAGAEESLQRLLAYNPLLEEAHIDLIRAYASSGQPAKVRRQYAALTEILRREANATPTEATRQLVEELLRNAPVQSSLSTPAAPELTTPAASVEAEMEALWQEATRQAEVPQLPASAQTRTAPLWVIGAVCLLLLAAAIPLLNRRNQPSQTAPPLQYNQEKWKFIYTLQKGETGDAEPRAMVSNNNKTYGYIYITGLVEAENEDKDILTLQLSPDGKLLRGIRYSSPEHDCDRAYAITQETKQEGTVAVYVAGETYIPSGHGTPEGWRIVLIKYDTNLVRQWVRRSPVIVHNELHNIRVAYSEDGGITVGGTALENGVHKMLLLRYNRDGELLWQRTFNPPNAKSTILSDMAADSKGNVYACGTTLRDVSKSGSHTEWATLCYDGAGKQIWARFNSGSGRGADVAYRLSIAEREQFVYVLGEFYNGDPAVGGAGTNLALAQYKLDGTPQWTRSDSQSGPEISPLSIARNSRPDIITIAGTKPTPERNSAIFFSQYDSAGNRRWNRQYIPPTGFKSARDPSLVTMERDEVAVLGSISDLSSIWEHQHSQFLLARYTIEGVLQNQYAFKMQGDMNRPLVSLFSQKDDAILVGGQTQQADKKMALVILKY